MQTVRPFKDSFEVAPSVIIAGIGVVSRVFLFLLAAMIVLIFVEFYQFRNEVIRRASIPITSTVDGIVVLTGGPQRIKSAFNLLKTGKSKSLLISGVHPHTSRKALFNGAGIIDGDEICCVELGKSARNTIENAQEANQWVERNGVKKLIIVSSPYHLPRSLLEFEAVLKNVKIIPYPARLNDSVMQENVRSWGYYLQSVTLREYGKYIAAKIRHWINYRNPLTI